MDFGLLSTISLEEAYIYFQKNDQGKFRPSNIIFHVISDLNLEIWESPSVKLDNITLAYHYDQNVGTAVVFACNLDIGETNLDTIISYNGPGSPATLLAPPPGGAPVQTVAPPTQAKANTQGSWAITSTYDGTISLFNIVKRMTDVDLKEKLSGNDLTVIREALDVNISKVTLNIIKQADVASVGITANTDWLVFKTLAIRVKKSALGWSFSLALGFQNDLLSLLPGKMINILSEFVKVDDTLIALFVGELDHAIFPPLAVLLPPPQWASNGKGAGVAVSTRLRIDGTTK